MNEKIPLRRFANAVAEKSGIDVAEAEAFIKALFKLVADELRTGQSVHVGSLGEFRLTNNPDDPVMFVPDAAWADAVNAPFAMFEPVELAEDITEQELADAAEEFPHLEPEEEEKEEEPQPEPEEPQPVPEEPQPVPVADVTVVAEPEPVAETPIIENTPEPEKPVYRWPEEEEEEEAEEAESVSTDDETPAVEEIETTATASGSFSRGFFVGLIVGLAIGALALCAYVLYYVNTPAGELPLSTELDATEILPAN